MPTTIPASLSLPSGDDLVVLKSKCGRAWYARRSILGAIARRPAAGGRTYLYRSDMAGRPEADNSEEMIRVGAVGVADALVDVAHDHSHPALLAVRIWRWMYVRRSDVLSLMASDGQCQARSA